MKVLRNARTPERVTPSSFLQLRTLPHRSFVTLAGRSSPWPTSLHHVILHVYASEVQALEVLLVFVSKVRFAGPNRMLDMSSLQARDLEPPNETIRAARAWAGEGGAIIGLSNQNAGPVEFDSQARECRGAG